VINSMPGADKNNPEEILQLERAIFSAIQSNDARTLEAIVADDFRLRSRGNPEANKAAFLNAITGNQYKILSISSEDMKVDFFGDVAILTGTQTAVVELDGKSVISLTAFTDVFQRRGPQWLLVLAHSIELPC